MKLLNIILIVFFAINAIFWGLFPHNMHCNLIHMIPITCPDHYVHLIIGLISFIFATKQTELLFSIF